MFDGAVFGFRWKSFKILTLSGVYPGKCWPLDFGEEIWTSEDVMTFFWFYLILVGNLDVGRRDDLFGGSSLDFGRTFFSLHLIWIGKSDFTLSVSRVRLRQPRSC